MAQGKFQSDRTSAPKPIADQIAKRKEHDANGSHRWHEYLIDDMRQRQCTVKACATIETMGRDGMWH